MMPPDRRCALVLRPEPGNAATAARLAAAGIVAHRLPLFAVRPLAWSVVDPAHYDALLLTSANAVRHAGPMLAHLAHLPVVAVGAATAAAAREAGLRVLLVGTADAAAVVARAHADGLHRLLHLSGRDRASAMPKVPGEGTVDPVAVYASDALPVAPDRLAAHAGAVALLHSARAARRFATLVDAADQARGGWALAALSHSVAAAAGTGWEDVLIAARPNDDALIAALLGRNGRQPVEAPPD